ncbi:MAG: hypothetical protein JNM90_14260 [Burkholderiales bacterium]|nr:hypothetical protein [Burkholderiales bacterium]
MSGGYPRVLFLTSSAFNRVTGGGLTFGNLFAGWPKDALATVHNDPVPVSTDVCDRYYRLSADELHRWGPLRRIGARPAPAPASPAGPPDAPGLAFRFLRGAKNLVFGDTIPESVHLSPALEAWVAAFRPQILYTILGSNAMMELALMLSKRFNLALVPHIMDDWPAVLHRGGLLSGWQRRRMQALLARVMASAAARLAICEDMAAAYALRYGAPFTAFQNTVDVVRLAADAKTDLRPGRPLRVAYIGSILPFAQLDSLVDCCDAVASLADAGMAIRLDIYSPGFLAERYRPRLVRANSVFLHDTIAEDARFFATLRDADVLLLPVNFDDYTVSYIRYSMPTKVPAYLAIGTPILAYGPAEVAQVAYARRAGWGLTVCERGVAGVARALRRLGSDLALRETLSAAARATALAQHDAGRVRVGFQALLRQVGTAQRDA